MNRTRIPSVLAAGVIATVLAVALPASSALANKQHPSPLPRAFPGTAYDAADGKVVLFGGSGDGGYARNDTWTWDGTDWTHQHPVHSPPKRSLEQLAYDSAKAKFTVE
jgi:hypothetical protein